MASDNPAKHQLPKVDFSASDLSPGSASWDSVRGDVMAALKEYGCFEAACDQLFDWELHTSLFRNVKESVELPEETKRRFADTERPYHGYVTNLHFAPGYHAMGIGGVLDSPAIQNLTDLMWPDGNAKFCEIVQSYSSKASELEKMVKRMILEGLQLPVEKYRDDIIDKTSYFLRIMKYDGIKEGGTEEVSGTNHRDPNFVTILREDGAVNGLEVKAMDGQWIRATPSASSFMVILGDAIHGWSNGRLYSPVHRVVMRETRARHAIGLFSTMKGVIRCPGELVDKQHPLLFKPFEEIDLMRYHRILENEEGWELESTLRARYLV
ncbi:probable 2-oxoglutarate-dependent dioxygenase AOP1 [Eucalyptus grandis]|uniref:probable 2-oxoglutarate-dependent dioxygenase AOP1 n=1 Tax=Eucalyptus grandis TaxID=71139 RepID=UPI00192EA4FC|nr:probable 2-oxoglutarate-dependent dioxygenase AOP1 [Eucalyptus grandis]